VVRVLLQLRQQTEFGARSFCGFSQFEKLGLRVGEKHLLEVLKADQNIGEIIILNAAGVFDVVKFKEYFKANLLKLNS
jgi:hypothetical protein